MKINFIKLLYEEENNMKNNKGITLVALVVTIVVLLILAGVSINLVLGNNGIIAKAQEAKTKQAEASQNDLKGMNSLIEQMESTLNGSGNGGKTEPETVPYLPSDDFHYDTSTSIDTGLVIKDGKENEYVWVVVPRTAAVYKTTGLGKTTFTDADYTSIEKDLKDYTSIYVTESGYSDLYYPDDKNVGWFADETAYNNLKNSMLKSVYENGGFYVGRYEAGIETTGTNRTSNTDKNSEGKYITPSTTPVSKADAYPYTYVTRTQAQNLASNVNSGTKISSLMFGVQWDLVLAFMHNKGNIADSTLTSNSTTIGNYNDNLWTIKNAKAQYSEDDGDTFTACPNPFKKESESEILLTTGADSSFSVQNIYDIAGNVWEFTLERSPYTNVLCARRGGGFNVTGSDYPAALRFNVSTDFSGFNIGFRVSLF
jgi:competence protein ComGC